MGKRGKIVVWCILIVSLLAYSLIEHITRTNFSHMPQAQSVYLLPDREVAPVLSLGFRHIWADLLLLKSQIFVHDHRKKGLLDDGKKLKEMIRLIMELDPHNVDAIIFGAFALSEFWRLMGVADANEILEEGFSKNSDDHRLPMNIGFNYYLSSKNNKETMRWFNVALQDPDAPRDLIWSVDNIATGDRKSLEMHRSIICSMCEQSLEESQRRNLCTRCGYYSILLELEEIRKHYEKREGRPLAAVEDLIRQNYLDALPPDPLGGEWTIGSNGEITSTQKPEYEHDL